MGNNKDPNKTRPGEMPPGKFHYNPGNMSGKTLEMLNVTKMMLLSPWIRQPSRSNQKHRSRHGWPAFFTGHIFDLRSFGRRLLPTTLALRPCLWRDAC